MDLSDALALVLISVGLLKPPDGWVGRVACDISCLHGVSGDLSGASALVLISAV